VTSVAEGATAAEGGGSLVAATFSALALAAGAAALLARVAVGLDDSSGQIGGESRFSICSAVFEND